MGFELGHRRPACLHDDVPRAAAARSTSAALRTAIRPGRVRLTEAPAAARCGRQRRTHGKAAHQEPRGGSEAHGLRRYPSSASATNIHAAPSRAGPASHSWYIHRPMARFIDELKRTHRCGDLRATRRRQRGRPLRLGRELSRSRRLRLLRPPRSRGHHADRLRSDHRGPRRSRRTPTSSRRPCAREWVIGVRGIVTSRGGNKNPKLPTGEIEIRAVELDRLQQGGHAAVRDRTTRSTRARRSASSTATSTSAARRSRRRSRSATASTRRSARYFDSQGFLELETPFMVKYTPGGARNFLVPSRMSAGQVLRARREPAALQAALHGGGLRSLLPDRQVLPRRGPPRRPAARVHADRRRDVVREPGRHLPHRWKA